MVSPTVEIAYAPATEVIRRDPHNTEALAASVSILKAQDGVIKIYSGLQHEDRATAYLLVVWDSYEHHEKLMNDAATYPKLTSAITSMFDVSKAPITMVHAQSANEPYKALEAPVSEIATFTLHEGQSKSELEGLLDQLVKHLTEVVQQNRELARVFHTSWGPTREKDNVLVLFIGWPSVEAHFDLLKGDSGAIANIIGKCRAISDVKVIHIPLALL